MVQSGGFLGLLKPLSSVISITNSYAKKQNNMDHKELKK